VRLALLLLAAFLAGVAALQWRQNQTGQLDEAVSTLDRRLKQLTPLVPAGLAVVVLVLAFSA